MKIAIMGSGGVGGFFGGRLAASGANVTFIARGAHLAAMREHGLKIESPLGNILVNPVNTTDDPVSIGTVDLVIIAVKLWSIEEAALAVQPLVGPHTGIIPLQNGVDAVNALLSHYGPEHVMGGVAHIAAAIESPGVIRHNGAMQKLTFGELDGHPSQRAEKLFAACQAAGIDTVLSNAIQVAIWEKFVFLSAFSGVTALTRLSIGPLRADPDTRALFLAALREAIAVGRAQGVELPLDCADRQLAFGDGLPPEMISSMLGDLRRGNRLEVPWLSGAVMRIGKELGVATPVSEFIYTALKLHAAGQATAPG